REHPILRAAAPEPVDREGIAVSLVSRARKIRREHELRALRAAVGRSTEQPEAGYRQHEPLDGPRENTGAWSCIVRHCRAPQNGAPAAARAVTADRLIAALSLVDRAQDIEKSSVPAA